MTAPKEKKETRTEVAVGHKSESHRQDDRRPEQPISTWKPVSELGQKVNKGEITDIEEVFNKKYRLFEAEIVDALLPGLSEDLLLVGQAKGKFGGGQRRIFRQTQKKTREGNKIQFMTCALVGNKNGYVGVATGKSKETVPARDKSKRKARLNLIRVRRGCGSWECNCGAPHSIPFTIEGSCGSSTIKLMPAPKGKGLCIEKECAKILAMAGIKDIWSKTQGQTKTKLNLIAALIDALKKLNKIKVGPEDIIKLGVVEGKLKGGDEIIFSPEHIMPEHIMPEHIMKENERSGDSEVNEKDAEKDAINKESVEIKGNLSNALGIVPSINALSDISHTTNEIHTTNESMKDEIKSVKGKGIKKKESMEE